MGGELIPPVRIGAVENVSKVSGKRLIKTRNLFRGGERNTDLQKHVGRTDLSRPC